MNFLTDVVLAPVTLPAKGLLFVFDKINEEAEREINDPAKIRAALIELQNRLDAGEITLEQYERAEVVLLAKIDAIEQRRLAKEQALTPVDECEPTRRRRRRRR